MGKKNFRLAALVVALLVGVVTTSMSLADDLDECIPFLGNGSCLFYLGCGDPGDFGCNSGVVDQTSCACTFGNTSVTSCTDDSQCDLTYDPGVCDSGYCIAPSIATGVPCDSNDDCDVPTVYGHCGGTEFVDYGPVGGDTNVVSTETYVGLACTSANPFSEGQPCWTDADCTWDTAGDCTLGQCQNIGPTYGNACTDDSQCDFATLPGTCGDPGPQVEASLRCREGSWGFVGVAGGQNPTLDPPLGVMGGLIVPCLAEFGGCVNLGAGSLNLTWDLVGLADIQKTENKFNSDTFGKVETEVKTAGADAPSTPNGGGPHNPH